MTEHQLVEQYMQTYNTSRPLVVAIQREQWVTIANEKKEKANGKWGFVLAFDRKINLFQENDGTSMYVIDIDMTTNKIRGIGIARNYTTVYKGLYVYMGKYYLPIKEVNDISILDFITILEILCLQGRRHLKRTYGIVYFPKIWLYRLRNNIYCPPIYETISTLMSKIIMAKK